MRQIFAAAFCLAATAAFANTEDGDYDTTRMSPEERDAFRLCVRMGVLPGEPAMAECLAADTETERVTIADRAQYGTR